MYLMPAEIEKRKAEIDKRKEILLKEKASLDHHISCLEAELAVLGKIKEMHDLQNVSQQK